MADLFCRDFRSLTTNSNLHLHLSSKSYYPSSVIHSYSLRIHGMRRRPFHLLSRPSSAAFSSPDIDVISTHEHSDGSLIFRFGDPSEVAKNVEVEETKTVKEEIEKENEDGVAVVTVSDGDHEEEGMVKKADTGLTGSGLTETVDHVNSVISSNESTCVDEGENDSSEKFLESSNDTKLTVSISSEDTEVNSTSVVDMHDTGNIEEDLSKENEDLISAVASISDEIDEMENNISIVEEKVAAEVLQANLKTVMNEENEDSVSAVASIPDEIVEMENNISIVEEKEAAEVLQANLKTVMNEENKDLKSAVASIPDEIVEMENNISIVEEKEAAEVLQANLKTVMNEENVDLISAAASKANEIVEMENNNTIVEEKVTAEVLQATVVNEEEEDSSPAVATIPDESAGMENNNTIIEEKETADVLQSSLETVVTTDYSTDFQHETMETEMQKEIIEDGKESTANDLVSPSPESEPALSMSEEAEDQNLQEQGGENDVNDLTFLDVIVDNSNGNEMNETEIAEAQASEIVEDESENHPVELVTVSTQLEAETVLGEEPGTANVDESGENGGAESLKVNLVLESRRTEVDDSVQGDVLVEASVHEVTELNSAEPATESKEILTTEFVLSSGAALLPHPSKVLTGGEDAYFIAGQTWLGVADGVEQWSLEGTKSGVYAQELVKICERLISDCNGNSVNSPLELFSLSVSETQYPGSSTALIAQFDGQALHVANIGDSGFIVLRHGAVYKKSSPMFHEFHFPLQIERGNDPSSLAEVYKVDLEEGDVIITATDGLLDNLYDQEISLLVMNSLASDKKPKEIAELLATKAQGIGSSPSGRSPFADEAQAAGYSGYTGGKLDDVTVVVSLVEKRSHPQTL